MPALRAAAPPAGTESDQNVMLWGPPATLVNRTVAPEGIVIEFGSKAALVLPLPVILTSMTGPLGATAPPAASGAGGAACGCLWVWSPYLPQARPPMGTNARDQLDVFGVPGFSLPGLLPAGASLFAVIPWKQQIAFETSLSALQGNAVSLLGDASLFQLGVRGDYALTSKVYAAAGGALNWIETNGQHETQLGVSAALGYRFGFIRGLR